MTAIDYTQYYDLENYLFGQVSMRFELDKTLSAHDFFCIIIWKSNRAKSKIAKRLLEHGPFDDLETAVRDLTQAIGEAASPKERLAVLIKDWGFQLPMASAILTVLFPTEFTVYDVRVCEMLGDFQGIKDKKFDALWEGYSQYIERVRATVPQKDNLRDKDRYLWGQSFYEQLTRDIANQFRNL